MEAIDRHDIIIFGYGCMLLAVPFFFVFMMLRIQDKRQRQAADNVKKSLQVKAPKSPRRKETLLSLSESHDDEEVLGASRLLLSPTSRRRRHHIKLPKSPNRTGNKAILNTIVVVDDISFDSLS